MSKITCEGCVHPRFGCLQAEERCNDYTANFEEVLQVFTGEITPLEGEHYIICQVCQQILLRVSNTHLKRCSKMTMQEYKDKYSTPMLSNKTIANRDAAVKAFWETQDEEQRRIHGEKTGALNKGNINPYKGKTSDDYPWMARPTLLGDLNPSRQPEVVAKIRAALQGRWVAGEGKSQEEIDAMLAENLKRYVESIYHKRYTTAKGLKVRSSLELDIIDWLDSLGIQYMYEQTLRLKDGSRVVPDITTAQGVIIEISGSSYPAWRRSFENKIRRMLADDPSRQIIVITYPQFAPFLTLPSEVKLVVWGSKIRMPKLTWLFIEGDKLDFDYTHFLPNHSGCCASLHGHTSVVNVWVEGYEDDDGFICDFGIVKRIVKEVLDTIDHRLLVSRERCTQVGDNVIVDWTGSQGKFHLELPTDRVVLLDTENSTCESIVQLIADQVLDKMPRNVVSIQVKLTEGNSKGASIVRGRNFDCAWSNSSESWVFWLDEFWDIFNARLEEELKQKGMVDSD